MINDVKNDFIVSIVYNIFIKLYKLNFNRGL